MSFQQVYYTSCTSGLGGGKGFQINAATPSISAAVLQQVERLGGYVPPLSAPKRPSPEELDRFPLSLLFHRLHDKSALVAQAKYVATDYSGRFGNYFTHTLIATRPMEDFHDILPIELWRSPTWTVTESPSMSLETLDQPRVGGTVNPLRVQEFLSQSGRAEKLAAFLTAIEAALRTNRRMVIVDEGDSVALWIAAATYALPRHIALDLTFNTYVKNPYQTDALIVGTTPDSDFSFAPHEIEHQFYVFDFHGSRFTPITNLSGFAVAVSAAYQAGRMEDVVGFVRFVARIAPSLPLQEIENAFSAYASLAGLGSGDPERTARWCAPRIALLDAAEVKAVFSALTSRSADHESSLDVAVDLYLAASRAGDSATAAIEVPFWEWLLHDAAGTCPAATLLRIVSDIELPPGAIEAARPLRRTWLEQLTRSKEPIRLCALLELGERLGMLADAAEQLTHLGEHAIAPGLSDAVVQRTLKRLATTPAGPEIVAGVGTFFVDRATDGEALRSLAPVLSELRVFEQLQQCAIKNNSKTFYWWLRGTRTDGHAEKRLAAFLEGREELTRLGLRFGAGDADLAVDAVWGTEKITVGEANELLKALRDMPIDGTRLLGRLFETLQTSGDLSRSDADRDQLAKALADIAVINTSPAHRKLLNAHSWAARLRTRDSGAAETIAGALGALSEGPKETQRGLLDLISGQILAIEDPVVHAELLRQGEGAANDKFLEVYSAALERALLVPAPELPARLARLIVTWNKGGTHIETVLLDSVLPRIVEHWSRTDLNAVEHALALEPALQIRFHSWRKERPGRTGLFGRIKSWLFVGMLLLLLLTGISIGLKFLVQP